MTSTNSERIGTVIDGRYQIEAMVARGGMATVYRARDLRLQRVVALKIMHGALAEDHDFVARFIREARASASLTHPAIVGMYDQGEADGVIYLAMEFVEGRTLREVINEHGRLTPDQALAVVEPVLEALNAAHKAGYAHRDIKPENVLISTTGQVKVADFGLARAIESSSASGLTQGLLIGTVAYLAPEQVERGAADARTDVYSAGIVLYECVVGQTPFSGDTPLSVAYQHVHATVPAPSSIRSDLPAQIDNLVGMATKQDPELRYTDAADFVDHLRAVRFELHGEPVSNEHNTIVLARVAQTVTVGHVTTTPLPDAAPAIGAGVAVAAALATETRVPDPSLVGPPGGPWVSSQAVNSEPPAPPADNVEKKPRRPWRGRALIAFLVLVLIAAGAGFGSWAWTQSQIVMVPQLVGMSTNEATNTLQTQGVTLKVDGTGFSKTVPKGSILTSSPTAGTEIRKGDIITVTTSAGPQMVKIPKLAGETQKAAEADLRAIGLTSKASEEFSESVGEGKVISTTPAGGKSVEVGSEVSMVISKGPPPVTVPNVIATDRDSAVAKLKAAGLKVVVRNQLPLVVVGRVYGQTPSPGTVVDKGSTVTITLV